MSLLRSLTTIALLLLAVLCFCTSVRYAIMGNWHESGDFLIYAYLLYQWADSGMKRAPDSPPKSSDNNLTITNVGNVPIYVKYHTP